ncbi:MAG: hypothetical protein SGJ17_09475 [Hyphomicrobiales bacterium]|nr:hypothetical protein [Hyphomicrobiales bacterium]
MSDYRIEFKEPHYSKCSCHGAAMARLARIIYKNGDGYGFYYAVFTEEHHDKYADILVCLDPEWDKPKRLSFTYRLWRKDGNFVVHVIDGDDSIWSDGKPHLGRLHSRDETFAHPLIAEVWAISSQIWAEDEELRAFFECNPTRH